MYKVIATRAVSMVSVIALISGCTVGNVADAEKVNQSTRNDTNTLIRVAERPMSKAETGPVIVNDDIWLGSQARPKTTGDTLPRSVEREGVMLFSSGHVTLNEVAGLISRTTGIRAVVDDDVYSAATLLSGQTAGVEGVPAANDIDSPAQQGEAPGQGFMAVDFQGRLSTFLDEVAHRYRINWEYKNNEIRFYLKQVKTFIVATLGSSTEMSTEIGNDSSGGGGGGEEGASAGSQSFSSSIANSNLWDELVTTLRSIVTPSGGEVSESRAAGTVTVTATPLTMRKAEEFIQVQNARMSQMVTMNVRIVSVTLSDADDISTDFMGALRRTGNFEFLTNSLAGNSELGDGDFGWSILRPRGKISAAAGVMNYLATKGDVSDVKSSNVTTMNNVPVPIQDSNSRKYIDTVNNFTNVGDSQVTTTEGLSTVQTGLSMQVMPRILNNGMVAMQYNGVLSELVGPADGFDILDTAGGGSRKAPNMNSRSFSQQVMVPSGGTLVLAGLETSRASVQKSGRGIAHNLLMGGTQNGALQRSMLVIMITPVILDTKKFIEELK